MPSSDPRFARLKSDPRFRRPRKKETKVVIDDRFKSLLESTKNGKKKGKSSKRVDKYGRSISENHENEKLEKYYRLQETDNEVNPPPRPDYARGEALLESSDEDEPIPSTISKQDYESDEEDSDIDGGLVRLDRGDDVDLNEDFDDLDQQAKAYAHAHADETDSESEEIRPTRRLAAVNLDWEHVKAHHLFKICSSVLSHNPAVSGSQKLKSALNIPVLGQVVNVRVYPSEFGKERMAKEEIEGPPAEIFRKRNLAEDEINAQSIYDVANEDAVDEDALRKYQLERLRYYYAVITCDSVAAATHVYTELDGTELERSANIFDLSYVPEEMEFDTECRDEATSDTSIAYQALDFTTDALRHSKVKLTWDEDDQERVRTTRRTLTREEIENGDFRAYLASSGSEDEGNPSNPSRGKLRDLLLIGGDNDVPEGWGDNTPDVQITFTPGLIGENGNETTIEKYQRKLKEKKRQKRDESKKSKSEENPASKGDDFFGSDSEGDAMVGVATQSSSSRRHDPSNNSGRVETTMDELVLLASSGHSQEKEHFDMRSVLKAEKTSKRKGKKKGKQDRMDAQETFTIDVEDDRFKAVHEDPRYAIDPTNPHFKKTSSMATLLQARSKRKRQLENSPRTQSDAVNKEEKSLSTLVERVKGKSVKLPNTTKRQKIG